MIYSVYGLVDAATMQVFYVGQSAFVDDRVLSHRFKTGRKFNFCIFGEFEDRTQARRLERQLILTLPNLTNISSNVVRPTPEDGRDIEGEALLAEVGLPAEILPLQVLHQRRKDSREMARATFVYVPPNMRDRDYWRIADMPRFIGAVGLMRQVTYSRVKK